MARRYYSVGVESDEVEAEEAAAAEATTDEGTAQELDTTLATQEVDESTSEGEEREESIDEAVEVTEDLTEDLETAEAAQENGGLDKYAAHFLITNTNRRLQAIGMRPIVSPVNAMEAFGSVSTRQGATQLAIESISQKLADIWKAIVNAFKKAARWIRDHFVKVFGGFEKLKKRAEALKERAGKASGKAESNTIENDRVANALAISKNIKDNANGYNDFFTTATKVLETVPEVANKAEKLSEKVGDLDIEDTKTHADVSDLAKETIEAMTKDININGTVPTDAKIEDSDKFSVKSTSELPGGKIIVKYTPKDGNDSSVGKIKLANASAKATKLEGKSLKTLSTSDAEDLCESVSEIADIGIANRKSFDKIADNKDKLVKSTEKLAKTIANYEPSDKDDKDDKDDTTTTQTSSTPGGGGEGAGAQTESYHVSLENEKKGERGDAQVIRRLVVDIEQLIGNFQATFSGYTLNTCKSILDYAELSIKQYK